eukprot:1125362_1
MSSSYFLFFAVSWIPFISSYYAPEQIHIECGRTPDNVCFEWVTTDDPIRTTSVVLLSKEPVFNFTNSIKYNGITRIWTDPQAPLHSNRTMHLVNITNLIPKHHCIPIGPC